MPERVTRRTFIGTAGAAAVAAALPLVPVPRLHGAAHDGREGALRDTAHLYERPT